MVHYSDGDLGFAFVSSITQDINVPLYDD